MAASNWEQKKKNALDLLCQLLDIWQGLNRVTAKKATRFGLDSRLSGMLIYNQGIFLDEKVADLV